jgi:hypothetical protein
MGRPAFLFDIGGGGRLDSPPVSRSERNDALAHAQVSGSPGARPRVTGLVRAVIPLLAVAAAGGYLLRAAWPAPAMAAPAAGLLLIALAAALALALRSSRRRLLNYITGALGEERVARELAFLPAGYHVFHGVAPLAGGPPHRGRDYDHVVVGPTGVFVVETKNWRGEISLRDGEAFYNGKAPTRPPLEQARAAAHELRDGLQRECGRPVEVQPVVCFVDRGVDGQDTAGAGGVVVCRARALRGVLTQQPAAPLPAETLERVVGLLQRQVEKAALAC